MLWLGRQPSLGEGVSPFILRSELRGWGVYNDYGVINRFIVSLTNTRNLINEYLCYSIWWYNGSVGITLPFFYMPRSWQHHQVLSDNLFPHPPTLYYFFYLIYCLRFTLFREDYTIHNLAYHYLLTIYTTYRSDIFHVMGIKCMPSSWLPSYYLVTI